MDVRGRLPIKWKDSVMEYLRGIGDRRLRGMEKGCCGCERKATYKMEGQSVGILEGERGIRYLRGMENA